MAPCSWDSELNPRYRLVTTGNVSEVLPGITRPLPCDLINQWDFLFADGMARALDVPDLVPAAPPPAMNVLGFAGGRWTLGVAWSLAITQTYQVGDSTDMLAQFVEGDGLESGQAVDQERARRTRERILRRWRGAEGEVERQRRVSRRAYARSRQRDHTRLPGRELLALVDGNSELCAELFVTHVIVSVGGGEFTGLLSRFLAQHVPGHPPEWVTTLTSALQGVESARPGKALWDLARLAGRSKPVAREISSSRPGLILARLAAPPGPAWADVATAYRALVEEFGYRGQREVDPSCATWDEAPEFLLGALRADLAAPASANPHAREARAATARRRLEERIEAGLPPGTKSEFRSTLSLAQSLNRLREATKANWARACRNYRPPILELGRRLAAEGRLDAPDDVWFLRLAELRADDRDFRAAVQARKLEYEQLQGWELPAGLFELPCELVPAAKGASGDGATLSGLGVSGGVASGRARIVLSAEAGEAELQPGEVLVAPVTDAPWTPLFVPAAAVIVETGGMLSHAATVAREYGIPAVAGVKGATRLIPAGAMVTVNGSSGEITIHAHIAAQEGTAGHGPRTEG